MSVSIDPDEIRVFEPTAAHAFGATAAGVMGVVLALQAFRVATPGTRIALALGTLLCATIVASGIAPTRRPRTGLIATRAGLAFEGGTFRRSRRAAAWRDLQSIRRGEMFTPLWKPGTPRPRSVELVFRRGVDLAGVGYAMMRPTGPDVFAIAADLVQDEAAFVAALRGLSGRSDLALDGG